MLLVNEVDHLAKTRSVEPLIQMNVRDTCNPVSAKRGIEVGNGHVNVTDLNSARLKFAPVHLL